MRFGITIKNQPFGDMVKNSAYDAKCKKQVMEIELSSQEIAIIQSALYEYWQSADTKLAHPEKLGTIEKRLLEQSKELTLPVITKFENL